MIDNGRYRYHLVKVQIWFYKFHEHFILRDGTQFSKSNRNSSWACPRAPLIEPEGVGSLMKKLVERSRENHPLPIRSMSGIFYTVGILIR